MIGRSVIGVDDMRSATKTVAEMDLIRQKVNVDGVGGRLGKISWLGKMRSWSEVVSWE